MNQMWAILICYSNWGLCLERSLAIWTAFSYKSAAEKTLIKSYQIQYILRYFDNMTQGCNSFLPLTFDSERNRQIAHELKSHL